jgi:hypothetical protein
MSLAPASSIVDRVGLRYRALARVRADTAYWFWIGTHNDFDKIIRRFVSGR